MDVMRQVAPGMVETVHLRRRNNLFIRQSSSSVGSLGIGIRKAQHIMKMPPFLLKSGAVFLLMLISMGAYAIPLAYNDITLAQDESGR